MKIFNLVVILLITSGFLGSTAVFAQCPGGAPYSTLSYEVTHSSNGNEIQVYNFPKFNIPTGTLVSVDLASYITVNNYSYTLENNDANAISYRVRLVRQDEVNLMIDGTYVPLADNILPMWSSAPILLAPTDHVPGTGSDFTSAGPFTVWDDAEGIQATITSGLVNFFGSGDIEIEYVASTTGYATGGIYYTLGQQAEITYTFQITYNYCNNSILPGDFKNLSVVKINDNSYQVSWEMLNEKEGRNYVIEKSTNGKDFVPVTSFPSRVNGSGYTQYKFKGDKADDDNSKTLYRVVQSEGTHKKVSDIKLIQWPVKPHTGMKVFPNPSSTHVYADLTALEPGNWILRLLSLDGKLIQQENISGKNGFGKLNFKKELNKGIYVLQAINQQSGQVYVSRVQVN
ncbi:MAG TPA: choice-of-anchor E domain-containing protein [Parasegetibacter sp.]